MTTDSAPFDESAWTAGFRFALELAAWLAIYFAWGWIPLVLAVAALSLFAVPGDKHLVLVRVRGPVRILIEAMVLGAGIVGAWLVWGPAAGAALLALSLALVLVSHRRWVWMWHR